MAQIINIDWVKIGSWFNSKNGRLSIILVFILLLVGLFLPYIFPGKTTERKIEFMGITVTEMTHNLHKILGGSENDKQELLSLLERDDVRNNKLLTDTINKLIHMNTSRTIMSTTFINQLETGELTTLVVENLSITRVGEPTGGETIPVIASLDLAIYTKAPISE